MLLGFLNATRTHLKAVVSLREFEVPVKLCHGICGAFAVGK
jgi:hypothetical protein